MEKNKARESLIKINEKYESKDFKKCYELIKHYLKHFTYSMDLLLVKVRCEESLNKLEEALKTANMALFI
jgi:predicted RNA-binding protein Jag